MKVNKPKCPICGYKTREYSFSNRKIDKQWETWYKGHIKHHITVKAKNELWQKHLGIKSKTPHLDYFDKQKKTIIKRINLQIEL